MPPLPNPFVEVDQQLDKIVAALGSEWQFNYGARVAKMENLRHLWEELSDMQKPDDARYLVLWDSEEPRGDWEVRDRTHRVDRKFSVVVVRGKGYRTPEGTVVPFSKVCTNVRDRVRTMLDISEEFPVVYGGMRPLPNIFPGREANTFADAKIIEFSTANDIPAVVLEQPGQSDLETEPV